ncbi:MAG: ThuA domain-containing protein [Lentisphaeraceae bacterium]|nr:ThuA domain-containing protein [Lentisphaeraceae bacterium]
MKNSFFILLYCASISLYAGSFKVLLFTKPAVNLHLSIPDGIAALKKLAMQNNFDLTSSEDVNIFSDQGLSEYQVIIFLALQSNPLNNEQQKAFEHFIQSGGGFIGIHSAMGAEHQWHWFKRFMGAQFAGHSKVKKIIQVCSKDKHNATTFLPKRWERVDAWYHFKDMSPNVHTLLNFDTSKNEGNKQTSASAWYREFDGGRMFYTSGGHTKESYQEELFLKHILAGIKYCAQGKRDFKKTLPRDELFSIETIANGLHDPMEIAIAPDGRVFIAERKGAIKLYNPQDGTTKIVNTLTALIRTKDRQNYTQENGALGMTLDPDFSTNGFIYIYHSLKDKSINRLSRFTFSNNQLVNEKSILDVTSEHKNNISHEGGSLTFGHGRQLFLSTGDDTDNDPDLFTPIDERPGRHTFDAQRSSANSNDLRGSIIRIIMNKDGTYSIPAGNLWKEGTPKTRPEIYIKGCRNPYRISFDHETGYIYWGEIGPNFESHTHKRGPLGHDGLNRAREASFFGWPYFLGNLQAFYDYDYKDNICGQSFAKLLVNDSPNNTGLQKLPATQPYFIWYPTGKSNIFPELGAGTRTAMAGPLYRQGEQTKNFPAYFDNVAFFYEWSREYIKLIKMNAAGEVESIQPFLPNLKLLHPNDLELGPKGELYLLEYGTKWYGNTNGRLRKISFGGFNYTPIIKVSASKTSGAIPLKVHFDSSGTHDRDKDDVLTYEWDFGNGQNSSEPSPQVTFTKAGNYTVTFTVSDQAGKSARQIFTITPGNERPRLSFTLEHQGESFQWGQKLNYKVSASDHEDGPLTAAQISVTAEYRPDGTFKDEVKSIDPRLNGMPASHSGTRLLLKNACISCHHSQVRSKGPSFSDIAERYADNNGARHRLIKKVKTGGNGAWGVTLMPPQSHIQDADIKTMLDAIFSMDKESIVNKGENGTIQLSSRPGKNKSVKGIYIIRASATDHGANGLPPLTHYSKAIILKAPVHAVGKKRTLFSFKYAIIHGKGARYEKDNIGKYEDNKTTVSWNIDVLAEGNYHIALTMAQPSHKISTFKVKCDNQELPGNVPQTGSWQKYRMVRLGNLILKKGVNKILLQPLTMPSGYLANIRYLVVTPK